MAENFSNTYENHDYWQNTPVTNKRHTIKKHLWVTQKTESYSVPQDRFKF